MGVEEEGVGVADLSVEVEGELKRVSVTFLGEESVGEVRVAEAVGEVPVLRVEVVGFLGVVPVLRVEVVGFSGEVWGSEVESEEERVLVTLVGEESFGEIWVAEAAGEVPAEAREGVKVMA